ncbi:MAG: hypothetical protein IIC59_14440 [Proteobacteria bacterium]|nr:hypothetical protein [Pseudomonadota bacterium]MCH8176370.1 hypothetical protein [Pseudomonadota bacterium]
MKKLLVLIFCVTCFFVIGVKAQEYPEIVGDEDSYTLILPYVEFEDGEGEKKALSIELVASKADSELSFSIVESSLLDVGVDTPAAVSGEGACSRTTNAQLLACRADVQDDFFELQANCFNYGDADEQQECFLDAETERLEGVEECDDVEEEHDMLCEIFGEDPYDPDLESINFLTLDAIAANPNPYFPLVPGNIWVYEGEDETITVTVLDETKEILGIEAIVVQDVAEEDGEVIESTSDWYAQDEDGNVWYMGELSLNYEDGVLTDIDGSWEAGVDGAKAGILFRAMPIIGEVYRQEYRIGEAEDIAETLAIDADEMTDSGFDCEGQCLENLEYSPLEPGVTEKKYYVPGIGLILEIDLEEDERVELVDFTSAQ